MGKKKKSTKPTACSQIRLMKCKKATFKMTRNARCRLVAVEWREEKGGGQREERARVMKLWYFGHLSVHRMHCGESVFFFFLSFFLNLFIFLVHLSVPVELYNGVMWKEMLIVVRDGNIFSGDLLIKLPLLFIYFFCLMLLLMLIVINYLFPAI